VGKDVDASLSKADFVKLMTGDAMAETMAGSTFNSSGGGLFDANTRLMMLAYRRTRLLQDIADPSKRRNFLSYQTFNEAYGQTLGEAPPPVSAHKKPEPHPMSRLTPRQARLRASPRVTRGGSFTATRQPHPPPAPPEQQQPTPLPPPQPTPPQQQQSHHPTEPGQTCSPSSPSSSPPLPPVAPRHTPRGPPSTRIAPAEPSVLPAIGKGVPVWDDDSSAAESGAGTSLTQPAVS